MLKVIGVSEFFFFPVLVAALTSAEEFHSVSTTGCPAALSHFASRASWVVLPDPSIPSTTNSFPGYSWGVVRLFNMKCLFLVFGAGDFEANRQIELPLERRHVTMCGPQLQLRVAVRAKPGEVVIAAWKEVNPGERLRVAPIQAFGQPDNRRQHPHGSAQRIAQVPVSLVRFFGDRLAMISRHQRDDLDLSGVEAAQITILDQVVRMPVMPVVADVHADVVQ